MKISYRILWVDDEPTTIVDDRSDVEEFLEKFGIRADIVFVEAPGDGSIKQKIEHELKNPDLDMLMVDFNMNGLRGDELIKLIRETDHIYLPVIFYSTSTVDQLHDAVRGSKLDGVYIANRRFFINKVEEVVRSLLAKEQTVKQVRGLLMEGVTEVDAQFFEIFSKVWAGINQAQRSEVEVYLRGIVEGRVDSAKSKFDKFPPDAEMFDSHILSSFLTSVYDTHTRWRLTMKILTIVGHNPDDIAILKTFAEMPQGEKSLNALRNDYAHKTRRDLAAETDENRCIGIRKALRTQLSKIDAILGSE